MKAFIKSLLPPLMVDLLRKHIFPKKTGDQTPTIRIGDFKLAAPPDHILNWALANQPFRDQNMGVCAGYFSRKYPDLPIIDIGANIGDTAAHIACFARNPLILVEPSEAFLPYLEKNIAQIPNSTRVVRAMIVGNSTADGHLEVLNGSARFVRRQSVGKLVELTQTTLPQLINGDICLLKIDTDGFDYDIILASAQWLAAHRPALFFEMEVSSQETLLRFESVVNTLSQSGYIRYLVWDDPGFFLLSCDTVEAVCDLGRYLYEIGRHPYRKSIFNFDVLAVHERDLTVAKEIAEFYRQRQSS
jgi:FkbM family methyltransferase